MQKRLKLWDPLFKGIWSGSFLGIFRSATLSDFDVYNSNGENIGFIDGKVLDLSKARFDFQDKEGNVKAYAREEKLRSIYAITKQMVLLAI